MFKALRCTAFEVHRVKLAQGLSKIRVQCRSYVHESSDGNTGCSLSPESGHLSL